MTSPPNQAERTIVVLMRIMGVGGLLAIPAIFLPHTWMNSIHEFVGLGSMPDAPIVSYLARSLSAFYAMVGAITIYISLDIRRYRSLVRLGAVIVTILSFVLFGIDLISGLPLSWTLSEGPSILLVGLVVLACQRHIEPAETTREYHE